MVSPAPIRVLHVDDDAAFADMVRQFLERYDALTVETTTSVDAALDRIDTGEVDCVVSDYDMPGTDGLAFLATVRERHGDLPFILLTGKGSEEIASDAIAAGVTEYLSKGGDTRQYEILAKRIVDAVERRRSERALEHSEERYRRLVDTSPAPILVFDADRIVVYANEAAATLAGYPTPDTLTGTPIADFVHPASLDVVRERTDRVIDEREAVPTMEVRLVGRSGDAADVVAASAPITYDGDPAGQAILLDVTDLNAVRRELREERAFVDAALDALEDVFYVIDADRSISRVNRAACEVSGYDEAEILAMDPADFFAPDHRERVAESVERAFETGSTRLRADVLARDGERIPYEFRKRRLTDDDGAVIGVAGIGRDVDERGERGQ